MPFYCVCIKWCLSRGQVFHILVMTDSKPWFDLDLFVNLRTVDEDLFSVGNFILLFLNKSFKFDGNQILPYKFTL